MPSRSVLGQASRATAAGFARRTACGVCAASSQGCQVHTLQAPQRCRMRNNVAASV